MTCKIEYNKKGEIEKVLTPTGKESSVFHQLAKLPFNTKETALEAYKQTLTEGATDEGRVMFSVNDTFTDSYREALNLANGQDINVEYNGEVVQTIPSSTNPNTMVGFLNNSIKSGLIKETKVFEDGDYHFKAEGQSELKQLANEMILKDFANENSTKVTTLKDGKIFVERLDNYRVEDGTTFQQLKNKVGEFQATFALASKEIIHALLKPSIIRSGVSEASLVQKATNFFTRAGFKIVSIEEYKKTYASKHGVEPNAQALVDLSNKVLAFAEGQITEEVMSEEFCHLVLESIPQAELENALRNVTSTEEYAEFAEMYREAYSKDESLTEEEVEQKVRKEILGKIVSKGVIQELSPKSQTIFEYVIDLFRKFFNSLPIMTNKDSFTEEVSGLTRVAVEMLMSDNTLQMESLPSNVYYALGQAPSTNTVAELNKYLKGLLATAKDQESALKRGRFSKASEIEQAYQNVGAVETKISVVATIDYMNKQISFVEKNILEARHQGVSVSPETTVLSQSLKNNINPMLAKMKEIIKDDSVLSKLQGDIDSLQLRIADLDVSADPKVINTLIDKTIMRHKLPATININGQDVDTREYFQNAVDAISKDTNTIYAYIGQASHAKDPLLNLLDSVIFDMVNRQTMRFHTDAKNFQDIMERNNFTPSDLAKFLGKDGFILSIFDFAKYEQDIADTTAQHFFNALSAQKASKGETMTLTLEQIKETFKQRKEFEAENRLEGDFETDFKKGLTRELGKLRERAYTDKYFEDEELELQKLNLPQEAINKLKQLNFDRADIMTRVETKNGLPIIKAQEKIDLDAYNTERANAKALYNEEGELKQGLTVMTEAEFKQAYPSVYQAEVVGKNTDLILSNDYVKSGNSFVAIDMNTASVEAKIAYGVMKSDANFMQKGGFNTINRGDLPQKFLEMLNQMPTDEAKIDFFKTNVNMSISDRFYQPIADEFEAELQKGDATFASMYKGLQDMQRTRRELLKRYKDSKNASNVLASKMPISVKEKIREVTKDIQALKSQMYTHMGVKPTPFQMNSDMESTVNEDYKNELRDLGIENNLRARLDFARKHMINDASFSMLNSALDMMKMGQPLPKYLENSLERALETLGLTVTKVHTDIADIQAKNIAKSQKDAMVADYLTGLAVTLAEQRLAPYYKTVTPKDVSRLMDELLLGGNIEAKINELKNAGVEMRVHHSFYDTVLANPNTNPNYKVGFLGNNSQPKLSKYSNVDKFEAELGVKVKKHANGQPIFDEYGIPEVTTTTPKFEVYKAFIEFHTKSLENTNSLGEHNLYLAPQVSKTSLDKMFTAMGNGKAIKPLAKELINELLTFRVDDQEQGQTDGAGESMFSKTGLRIIPKRYFNRLESPENLSSDLFYSSMLMRQESELHKARKEALTEVTAIESALLSKKYKDGKQAVATNTYKMAKSYIDYNIYGISEQVNYRTKLPVIGTVDFAKVAKMFHSFIRWKNLAFNLVIPTTSWLTAEANLLLEQWIGTYIDKDSIGKARKELVKQFHSSATEFLSVRTKGRLNLLGEFLGVYDMESNFQDSNKGKLALLLTKIPMGAHSMANFTPIAQTMLAGLYGQRLYNGQFLDKKQFIEAYKLTNANTNPTKAVINQAWRDLQSKSLYEYLDTSKGQTKINFDKLAKELGRVNDSEFQEEIQTEVVTVGGKIRKFIERIDGNIPQHEKTMLQRNYLGSFLMTHKGWQSIAITNRFKSSHLNLQTGIVEEGSYVTLMRKTGGTISDIIDIFKGKRALSDFLKIVKEGMYSGGNKTEKENMQRVGKDLALSFAVYMIAMLLGAIGDDDENKDNYLVQTSAILAQRVFNETKSSQFALTNEIYNTIKEPVVGFEALVSSFKIWEGMGLGDDGKFEQYWNKTLPYVKNFNIMKDAESIYEYRKSYEYFNKTDEWNIASLIVNSEEAKKMLYGE